jgi:hypothetical protein
MLETKHDTAQETSGAFFSLFPLSPAPAAVATTVSGLYTAGAEELRLDVDGKYPLMTASGMVPISSVRRLYWVARVSPRGNNIWRGGIFYKEPNTSGLPYTMVEIRVTTTTVPSGRSARVTFTGQGLPARVVVYAFRSPYFQNVEFEFDSEVNIAPELSIQTHAHPDHPATIPSETLTIQTVYQRAGFNVTTSPNPSLIPAPPGTTWSDMEMHDVMTAFWSRFSASARWAMWVLFARRHETGANLGGIMFDDIGPNHRQGTAIFYDSFISTAPAGESHPVPWVSRMRFWTAVHEMGHAFNLAHSWQKALGTPWIPLSNEPEARSYMNYPYNVSGGQSAFFANFEYRFSNSELLFMRHAPAKFVRMGDANWFDHHAFEQATLHPDPPLALEVRFNRPRAVYEFLEPVVAELKLKNISNRPQAVNGTALNTLDGISLAIKREGSPAKQYLPYARYCMSPSPTILQPGESIYASVFITAGLNGIDVAEPGRYVLQAALHQPDGDIVSAPAMLRIATPQDYEEELIAQDLFTDAVGRVLAFDGSHFLTSATDTLRQVAERLPGRRVAKHALVPLGLRVAEPAQVLDVDGATEPLLGGVERQKIIRVIPDNPEQAKADLTKALLGADAVSAAESLGHVDYKTYVDDLTDLLIDHGDRKEAANVQKSLKAVLAARGVAAHVLAEVDMRINSLRAQEPAGV